MKMFVLAGAASLMIGNVVVAGETQETLKATVVQNEAATTKPSETNPTAASTGGFQTATCSQGQNKRTVSISSQDPGKNVPCEVHYKKEAEQPGHDLVIYTANNEVSFCEAKAREFVAKLAGWGWTCN